ncbi:N-acetylglucosamine/diacetylchitobiose ABC transporter substrate-binding protein [Brachybacterium rhamnosum]|uniref:N-acetylglucosamine/diacetylchitobiose ABC transporter substrate-binding protein n=1 Tax=Brachybacterium rhamnosum TaxID=173361 RepID=A0ABW4PZ74_9MICO|nr:N-acetylglucosamine/diacetylchitobiose ABC transporter substrate-binding protein [Brachybacterium sp. SGAir0954]QCR53358.1 carbohydrate ABC transporter, N-acetylglucosamine/diacetylchitobiose-binding protein [Brachybacterium sp. SGAir0954]
MTARDQRPAEDPAALETPLDRLGASRRRFLSLAGVSAGAAGLAACAAGGGGGDDAASSDGGGAAVAEGGGEVSDENPFGVDASAPVDVVIFNGGFGDQYGKDAGKKYAELYPEADVKVSSTVNIQPDLQPRFIGGNPPDLFDNSGAQSMNTSALISDGSLGELGALIKAPSLDGGTIEESLLPGVLVPGTYSGKLFALNYTYTVFALWYSATQFEKEGWKAPASWDEVMAIGESAKSAKLPLFAWGGQNAADYYQELALSMAIKEGGKEVATKLDKLDADAFSQQTVVDAHKAIEEAVKAGYFMSGGAGIKHTEAQAEWVTGKAVMYPSGSWIENEQRDVTPEDFKMTGLSTPVLSDGAKLGAAAIHGAAGEPFMVPSKGKNGAGGLEFLRIMLSKEQCQNFSKLTSSITIVKDTVPEDAFGSTALASVNELIQGAGEDVFTYNFKDWYGLGPDIKPLWTEFLGGDITADECLERTQEIVDKVREDDSIEKFDVE